MLRRLNKAETHTHTHTHTEDINNMNQWLQQQELDATLIEQDSHTPTLTTHTEYINRMNCWVQEQVLQFYAN